METQFSHLATPITVCGKTIKNRVVVPPMEDFGMTGKNRLVNERHVQRYGSYAARNTGLIIIEACAVSPMKEPRNTISLFDDTCIPGLTQLARAATANNAVALVQLLNTGPEVMAEKEIAQIRREVFLQYKADFISAAERCKRAGFDGVELHAAHGDYLNQIVETSTGTDEYGRNFKNRIRILQELITEIKAGGDLLNVSTGCNVDRNIPTDFSFGSKIYAASLVKRVAHIPVICVRNITSGDQAECILENGYADMVAVGRGHLCDPQWMQKTIA